MAVQFETQPIYNELWGEEAEYYRSNGDFEDTFTGAKYPQSDNQIVESNGVYTIASEKWTFAYSFLEPRVGDFIRYGSIYRVITNVTYSKMLQFWAVDCQYPRLSEFVLRSAAVRRASPTPSNQGMRVPNFSTVATLYCWIQPVSRVRELNSPASSIETRATWNVVLERDITNPSFLLNAGDVLLIDSVQYQVLEHNSITSLGVYSVATVERME